MSKTPLAVHLATLQDSVEGWGDGGMEGWRGGGVEGLTEVGGDVLEVGLDPLGLEDLVVSQNLEGSRVVLKVALFKEEGGKEGGREGEEEGEGEGG